MWVVCSHNDTLLSFILVKKVKDGEGETSRKIIRVVSITTNIAFGNRPRKGKGTGKSGEEGVSKGSATRVGSFRAVDKVDLNTRDASRIYEQSMDVPIIGSLHLAVVLS